MENMEKEKTVQAKVYELLFKKNMLILGRLKRYEYLSELIKCYRERFPMYKAFAKYHTENNGHIHLVLYLMNKPKIVINNMLNYFTLGNYRNLEKVNLSKLSKQTSSMKKFVAMVNYITDGHDNGIYKDSANYKYDLELMDVKSHKNKAVIYLMRGMQFSEIVLELRMEQRLNCIRDKKEIMELYREYSKVLNPPSNEGKKLYPVQEQILKMFSDLLVGRKILLIYDKEGNNNKTFLAKYIKIEDPDDTIILPNARTEDIALYWTGQSQIIFNLPRSTNMEKLNYEVMENLLDGELFSGKYKSKEKDYSQCKVMILCNNLPCFREMTMQRWIPYEIRTNGELHVLKIPEEPTLDYCI